MANGLSEYNAQIVHCAKYNLTGRSRGRGAAVAAAATAAAVAAAAPRQRPAAAAAAACVRLGSCEKFWTFLTFRRIRTFSSVFERVRAFSHIFESVRSPRNVRNFCPMYSEVPLHSTHF